MYAGALQSDDGAPGCACCCKDELKDRAAAAEVACAALQQHRTRQHGGVGGSCRASTVTPPFSLYTQRMDGLPPMWSHLQCSAVKPADGACAEQVMQDSAEAARLTRKMETMMVARILMPAMK